MMEDLPHVLTHQVKVGLSTIAYNQPELLERLAASFYNEGRMIGVDMFLCIHVTSANKYVAESVVKYTNFFRGNGYRVSVLGNGKNIGVARCWNESILEMASQRCDVMLLANDDTWFSYGDLSYVISASLDHHQKYAVTFSGRHTGFDKHLDSHGFAFFAINPVATAIIGAFDQNFFPAYNEDVDYQRRAHLAGLEIHKCTDTNIHHKGSATIDADYQLTLRNQNSHYLNDRYWYRKWGCMKHDLLQGFRHPFDDPEVHPFYIPFENMHRPYGNHDRDELKATT